MKTEEAFEQAVRAIGNRSYSELELRRKIAGEALHRRRNGCGARALAGTGLCGRYGAGGA